MKAKGLPLPKHGEVIPKMNLKGAKTMLFKSGNKSCLCVVNVAHSFLYMQNYGGLAVLMSSKTGS